MSEPEYDNRKITDYLLGKLSAAEAERFDELSFTDDEFVWRLESAEKDLVDAYAGGELTPAEADNFKSHYLASPLRRDKARFAEALQEFAKQDTGAANTKKNSAPEPSTGFFSALNIFSYPAGRWAAAALVLAFVVTGFWIVRRQFNPPANDAAINREDPVPSIAPKRGDDTNNEAVTETPNNENINALPDSNQPVLKRTPIPQSSLIPKPEKNLTPPKPLVAAFFLNPPLRGTGGLQIISFPKEIETIKLSLKLEGSDYKKYRVALADESGKNLWRSDSVSSKNGTLSISLPAKLLKPQIYSLVVSGINPGDEAEIISSYPFKTVLR